MKFSIRLSRKDLINAGCKDVNNLLDVEHTINNMNLFIKAVKLLYVYPEVNTNYVKLYLAYTK